MTNKKISELDLADPITGTELLPLVQDGTTKGATVTQLLALITAGAPGNLDTFFETATQMGLDETTVTALQALVAGKADTASVAAGYLPKNALVARLADAAGVDPTGTTECGAAVQAFITANAGRTILINGTFLSAASLHIPSSTELLGERRTDGFIFTAAPNGYHIGNADQANGNTRISLRNFTIVGTGTGTPSGAAANSPAGILIRHAADIVIDGLYITKVLAASIVYQGVQRIRITGNTIYQGGRDGISGWWRTQALEDVVVADNIINTVGDDAIAINASVDGTTPNSTARPRRISITGNKIFGQAAPITGVLGRGILIIGAEDVTIADNAIENTAFAGIQIEHDTFGAQFRSQAITVTGNTITGAGTVGDGTQPSTGIEISGTDRITVTGNTISRSAQNGLHAWDTTAITVDGNQFDSNGASNTDFTIDIDGSGATYHLVSAAVVSNNTISNGTSAGIRMYYCRKSRAVGNTIFDCGNITAGAEPTYLSGIVLIGDEILQADGNTIYDSRTGAARTMNYGIAVPGWGGSPTILLRGNTTLNMVIRGIGQFQGAAVGVTRTGNHDDSTTVGARFDQDFLGPIDLAGPGSPNGVITAPVGSTYRRTDGSTGTTLFVKETGAGNTGWNAPATTTQISAAVATQAAADASTYATGTALTAGLAAKADLVGGVVPTAQIPALALTNTQSVPTRTAMLALTSSQVQPGDLAVVAADPGKGSYVLTGTDPSQLASWTLLNAPTDIVTSVAGKTGTVNLGPADVGADPAGAAASAQAFAVQRSNHTGTQPAATVTGLAPVATTGVYTDLTGRPSLATVATSGAYTDLTGVPPVPPSPTVQIFTSSGTWTKPAGCTTVQVSMFGAGGGGGGGARRPSGTAVSGGGGGCGGGWSQQTYPAASLPATVAVTVAGGGTGGAAPATDNSNGGAGSPGATSIFGNLLRAGGGSGGSGGSTGTVFAGAASPGTAPGGAGAGSTPGAAGGPGVGSSAAGGGGSAGGGISATPSATSGGAGKFQDFLGTQAAAGSSGGGNGGDGTDGTTNTPTPGGTGAGGGSSITGNGGNGGKGGNYGGGGGGGGSALNGNTPGAGGNGGDGIVIITAW